jgi:hypothetical protein
VSVSESVGEILRVSCSSLSEPKRIARAGVVGWWRRRTADPAKRVPLRRAGAVSLGVVIGSLVLARVIAATGSRALLALVVMVFVVAAITLFVVVIAWCQEVDEVDEIDTADPVWVTNRGVIARTMKRLCRNAAVSAERASRAGLSSASSIAAGLSSRIAGMVAALRREVTRDAVARSVRATAAALSGVPPPDASSPAGSGRLARPADAPAPPPPARVTAQAAETRDLHRGRSGVSPGPPRPTSPAAQPKRIHWSLPERSAKK